MLTSQRIQERQQQIRHRSSDHLNIQAPSNRKALFHGAPRRQISLWLQVISGFDDVTLSWRLLWPDRILSELPMPDGKPGHMCMASRTPEAGSAVVMNTLLDFGAMQIAGEMPPFTAAHPEPCLAHRGSKAWAFS
jgi:hypothetical protein